VQKEICRKHEEKNAAVDTAVEQGIAPRGRRALPLRRNLDPLVLVLERKGGKVGW
jgi:hypothetical protein